MPFKLKFADIRATIFMKIINGQVLAEKIKDKVAREIAKLDNCACKGRRPNLAIILVGEREDSKLYVSIKEREARKVGIDTHIYRCPKDIKKKEIIKVIKCLKSIKKPDRFVTVKGVAEKKVISDELSKAIASAKKERLLAEHKSFAAIEEYKFADYMQKGRKYMKQGRYYRSAEACSMALIFKSDDPSANIGKSHALFAAGEYMSSALFLAWALEIGPEYNWFKQNIITATGDRDIIETRIAEIEEILTLREVGELRFLSAYIYQHLGREKRAKEMMDIAYEKIADVPAAAILKKMINP